METLLNAKGKLIPYQPFDSCISVNKKKKVFQAFLWDSGEAQRCEHRSDHYGNL